MSKSKNDIAWGQIFEKHRILDKVADQGRVSISSVEINKYREARLMTKFDHRSQLPKLFVDNNLSILPTSRGTYEIGTFETFYDFNKEDVEVWTEGPLNGTKIKLVGTDSVSSLTISRYQEEAAKTAIYRKKDAIIYPAMGLANEAGEVLGKIKKVLRDKGGSWDEDSKKEVGKEIGDVMWYLAALSRDLGLDLGILSQENLIKLKSRKERGVLGGSGDNR